MRSSLLVLILLLSAVAHAEPDAPPLGAPAALKVYGCQPDGANRTCLECVPDTTGGTFCERCTREPDATPLSCLLPTAADLAVLSSNGITPSRNIYPTWRPKPAFVKYACLGAVHGGDQSCLECELDKAGGAFCERCTRDPQEQIAGPCSPVTSDGDRKELAIHAINPKPTRARERWWPWKPAFVSAPSPNLAAGSVAGITEYECIYLRNVDERICQECKPDNTCQRVTRSADHKIINASKLDPAEILSLTSHGVTVAQVQAPPAPPPSNDVIQTTGTDLPGGGTRVCQTRIVDGVAQQPVCTESGVPPPPPTSHRDEPAFEHRRRGISFGIEVGHASPGDDRNIYGAGYGRGYVLGWSIFEMRVETYDLPDLTKTYDNVNFATGRLSVYSVGARPTLLTLGPLEVTVLAGLAVLSRPSLALDPNDILEETQLHDQYGAGLLVGAGVRLFDVITVDLRGYLTSWQGMTGMRAEVGANNAVVYMPITESAGGTPITLNIGAGWAF